MTIQEHLTWDQVNDENLSFLKAIGVDYVAIIASPELSDGKDRSDFWAKTRKLVESHGMQLRNVGFNMWDSITLGLPDRDEKIKAWCTMLRNLGDAGIPTVGYNFKPIGNFRTESLPPGRGGSRYSTFDYEEFTRDPQKSNKRSGRADMQISEERMWENINTFLKHVIPVAEDAGVRMALHPDDPPIPEPLGGAARIVSTLDQYERIFNLAPSECNAMLFCQGCVAEMGEDVPSAIRRIGKQGKIVYVHFRNIRTGEAERIGQSRAVKNFQEVFLDEGHVDMLQAMQTYRDIGFNGPFMMDHTPQIPADAGAREGRAFAVGYIRATIQAIYR